MGQRLPYKNRPTLVRDESKTSSKTNNGKVRSLPGAVRQQILLFEPRSLKFTKTSSLETGSI